MRIGNLVVCVKLRACRFFDHLPPLLYCHVCIYWHRTATSEYSVIGSADFAWSTHRKLTVWCSPGNIEVMLSVCLFRWPTLSGRMTVRWPSSATKTVLCWSVLSLVNATGPQCSTSKAVSSRAVFGHPMIRR